MSEPRSISFFVPGVPRPGGSKRGFINRKTGRVIITEDCTRSKDWRSSVAAFAHTAMVGKGMFDGPLEVEFCFSLPRPKGHYRTGHNKGQVRSSAPGYPDVKPDSSKLARSTEDACTGIVWWDDARIVDQRVTKRYVGYGNPNAEGPGCWISVREKP